MKRKEKKTLHGVLMLMLLLGLMLIPGLLPETACAADGTMEGNGTKDNPYQIEDYDDLKAFAEIVNGNNGQGANPSACAILIDNIQCTDKEWVPINITDNLPYSGHFNGNGKIIKGLSNENREGVDELYNQGLFGVIGSGGLVENVGLEGGKIKGKNCVGGLAGFNLEGKIINCRNSGAVSGSDGCVGGLAGLNGGTITNCCNTGAVSRRSGRKQLGRGCRHHQLLQYRSGKRRQCSRRRGRIQSKRKNHQMLQQRSGKRKRLFSRRRGRFQ